MCRSSRPRSKPQPHARYRTPDAAPMTRSDLGLVRDAGMRPHAVDEVQRDTWR